MENKHTCTELSLTNDPRLMAALTAIVAHAAFRIGMDKAAQSALVRAAQEACNKAWPHTNSHEPLLRIRCRDFDDRLEVTVQENAGAPGAASLAALKQHVDRVSTETRAGVSSITLVEFVAGHQIKAE